MQIDWEKTPHKYPVLDQKYDKEVHIGLAKGC
jgi:hypothetical protein